MGWVAAEMVVVVVVTLPAGLVGASVVSAQPAGLAVGSDWGAAMEAVMAGLVGRRSVPLTASRTSPSRSKA